jgi:DeoR/GlpR family transcriptional regulator of sugar metabolism
MSITELTGNPRHDQLVHYIAERGYMNIDELAQLLDVSAQTIRRDIRKLSDQGLVTRHHGGAGRVSSVMNTAFEQRELSLTREKRAMAEAIADYLPDRCTDPSGFARAARTDIPPLPRIQGD